MATDLKKHCFKLFKSENHRYICPTLTFLVLFHREFIKCLVFWVKSFFYVSILRTYPSFFENIEPDDLWGGGG